jgi:hypothetical protein
MKITGNVTQDGTPHHPIRFTAYAPLGRGLYILIITFHKHLEYFGNGLNYLHQSMANLCMYVCMYDRHRCLCA